MSYVHMRESISVAGSIRVFKLAKHGHVSAAEESGRGQG